MDRKWFFIIPALILILGAGTYFSVNYLLPKTQSNNPEITSAPEGEFQYSLPNVGEVSVLVSTQSPDVVQVPVVLTNPSYIKGKLDEFGFWGQGKVVGFNEKGNKLDPGTAKALDITIVEETSVKYPFKAGDSGSFGITLDYDTGAMAIYVYLGEKAFETEDAQTLAKKISDITLTAVYLTTHPTEGIKLQSSQVFVRVDK